MAKRTAIVRYLNSYLKIDQFKDGSFNGLQFEGKDDVRTIAFAVTAGTAAFEQAAERGADMLVVHHGQFWQGVDPSAVGMNKQRLNLLYGHDLSLYASHLPLDRHPVVGNNAQLVKLLGARNTGDFGLYHGMYIGYVGTFNRAASLKSVATRLEEKLNTTCTVLPFGKSSIKTIGIVSGGVGIGEMQQAVDAGLDAFLTGEQCDLYNNARDAGLNVIFAGHHATETVGVKALMPVLAKRFGVKTVFVDVPTGL